MATYVAEALNDPTLYFETLIWTGDGNTPRSLSGLEFQPNMVWSKRRDDAAGHNVLDSVRGAGVDAELCPSSDGVEGSNNQNAYGYLSAFTSDGFTVTAGSSDNAYWNNNTATYVAWNWKESADAGFDIVTFTGNGSARTISHSLSAVPKMMAVKNRSTSQSWRIYHNALGATKEIYFDLTDAAGTSSSTWNDTSPTSSVFSVGGGAGSNENTSSIVAYLWAEKQGFSKFGKYTGNAADAGPFIYTGFRPAWIMCKASSDSGEGWHILDNKRDIDNPVLAKLAANATSAESATAGDNNVDFLSNGFRIVTNDNGLNKNGVTFIFAAFAEAPFVNSNGVPCNAR